MKNILVFGASGCVGKSLQKLSLHYDQYKWIFLSSKDGNLTQREVVIDLLTTYKPDIVINLAALVGRSLADSCDNVKIFHVNNQINSNIIQECYILKVKKLILMSSILVFSGFPGNTITINDLTHIPNQYKHGYTFSKLSMHLEAIIYRQQFGFNISIVIPSNIYGPYDNFVDTHFIAAIIKKMYQAKINNQTELLIQIHSETIKQFIYSLDVASFLVKEIESPGSDFIIAPSPVSMDKIISIIQKYLEYSCKISYTGPLESKREFVSAPFEFTDIEDGLKETIRYYINEVLQH